MNTMLDYCFTPAQQQTITHTGIKKMVMENQKNPPAKR